MYTIKRMHMRPVKYVSPVILTVKELSVYRVRIIPHPNYIRLCGYHTFQHFVIHRWHFIRLQSDGETESIVGPCIQEYVWLFLAGSLRPRVRPRAHSKPIIVLLFRKHLSKLQSYMHSHGNRSHWTQRDLLLHDMHRVCSALYVCSQWHLHLISCLVMRFSCSPHSW